MEDNNNVIVYESMFDEHNNNNNQNIESENEKRNVLINVLIYLFIMTLGFGVLFVSLFVKPDNKTEILLDRLLISNEGTIVYTDAYEFYEVIPLKKYQDKFYYVEYNNDVFVVHKTLSEDKKEWLDNTEVLDSILAGKEKFFPVDIEEDKPFSILLIYHFNGTNGKSLTNLDKDNFYPVMSSYGSVKNILLNFSVYLLVLIPIVLLNYKRIKIDFDILKADQENPMFGNILSGFIKILAFNIVLSLIIVTLSAILKVSDSQSVNQTEIVALIKSNVGVLFLLVTIIAAPIVEEVVFRYSVYKLVDNDKIAIHISAITFGLIHLMTEIQLIFLMGFTANRITGLFIASISYIGMGYLFSYLYKKSNKNLTYLIILHSLVNIFASIPHLF